MWSFKSPFPSSQCLRAEVMEDAITPGFINRARVTCFKKPRNINLKWKVSGMTGKIKGSQVLAAGDTGCEPGPCSHPVKWPREFILQGDCFHHLSLLSLPLFRQDLEIQLSYITCWSSGRTREGSSKLGKGIVEMVRIGLLWSPAGRAEKGQRVQGKSHRGLHTLMPQPLRLRPARKARW